MSEVSLKYAYTFKCEVEGCSNSFFSERYLIRHLLEYHLKWVVSRGLSSMIGMRVESNDTYINRLLNHGYVRKNKVILKIV